MLASLITVVAVSLAVPDTTELNADSLLKLMKQGGYTVLLRHARTDRSYMDDPRTAPLDDRTKQRNLSDAGVADAKAIGLVMREAGISFAEIVSSPMFRSKETAQLAFGEPALSRELMSLTASPEQRALVLKSPPPGTNRAIVTHHFIIERYVPGIKLGDIGESEAAVVRTMPNGDIAMVGRFTLADWQRLSGGKTGTINAAEQEQSRVLFQAIHGAGGAPGQVHPPPGSAANVQPFDWKATPATQLVGYYLHAFNSGGVDYLAAYTTLEPTSPGDILYYLDDRGFGEALCLVPSPGVGTSLTLAGLVALARRRRS